MNPQDYFKFNDELFDDIEPNYQDYFDKNRKPDNSSQNNPEETKEQQGEKDKNESEQESNISDEQNNESSSDKQEETSDNKSTDSSNANQEEDLQESSENMEQNNSQSSTEQNAITPKSNNNSSSESSEQETQDDTKSSKSNDEEENDNLEAEENIKRNAEEDDIDDKSSNNTSDFDDLLKEYEKKENNESKENNSDINTGKDNLQDSDDPFDNNYIRTSESLNSLAPAVILKLMKKLLYEEEENNYYGTESWDKRKLMMDYMFNRKDKVIYDKTSKYIEEQKTFYNPPAFYFDLSPSNDHSMQLYANAMASIVQKGVIVYLGWNGSISDKITFVRDCKQILRISDILDTQYSHLYKKIKINNDLYDSFLRDKIKKAYLFTDFDSIYAILELMQLENELYWFSTEERQPHTLINSTDYTGYYVPINSDVDIVSFIREKNKDKYYLEKGSVLRYAKRRTNKYSNK